MENIPQIFLHYITQFWKKNMCQIRSQRKIRKEFWAELKWKHSKPESWDTNTVAGISIALKTYVRKKEEKSKNQYISFKLSKLEEEQVKPKIAQARNNEVKIGIKEIENIKKYTETRSWFFEKSNKIDNPQ